MALYQVKHGKWGSNLARQLRAFRESVPLGDNGTLHRRILVERSFLGQKWIAQKKKFVGYGELNTQDDDAWAVRIFQHRCGVLKVYAVLGKGSITFHVIFDGHVVSRFDGEEVQFSIDPNELEESKGQPVADIRFQGRGRRWGPFKDYTTHWVKLTFANEEQMMQHLDVPKRNAPRKILVGGVEYVFSEDGQYRRGDGTVLLTAGAVAMASGGEGDASPATPSDGCTSRTASQE